MKLPERFPPDDPREWLNRARSNLAMAKNRVAGVYLEDLCFEAQQAAEKAIKAMLITRGIEFPYVHDLGLLLSLLERAGEVIPEVVGWAGDLTDYATTIRYPSVIESVTEQEYIDALEIAETVIQWAEERL
jgi:HEPN domain-containing protein